MMSKEENGSNSQPPKGPEFKPGDKPYTQFGNVMLNANVAWDALVNELIDSGTSMKEIADYAECPLDVIRNIRQGNFDGLHFRAGARICTLHYRAYPELLY